jgi:ankyrin repeat protein
MLLRFTSNLYSNLAAKERNGKTALHAACERGHEKIVRWLLERGADVKCYDSRRRTPVVVCFENNHVPLAKVVSTQFLVHKQRAEASQTTAKHNVKTIFLAV